MALNEPQSGREKEGKVLLIDLERRFIGRYSQKKLWRHKVSCEHLLPSLCKIKRTVWKENWNRSNRRPERWAWTIKLFHLK